MFIKSAVLTELLKSSESLSPFAIKLENVSAAHATDRCCEILLSPPFLREVGSGSLMPQLPAHLSVTSPMSPVPQTSALRTSCLLFHGEFMQWGQCGGLVRSTDSEARLACGNPPPARGYATSGKSLNLSMPLFADLQDGDAHNGNCSWS